MKLAPRLVIAGKLLRAPGAELDSLLQRELEANPALERLPVPPARQAHLFYRDPNLPPPDAEDWLERCPQRLSVYEQLACQVRQLASGERCAVALRLLENLDRRGFLRAAPEQLAAELGCSLPQVLAGLAVLHQLEPTGTGARDVRQCLELQLAEHETPHPLAKRLVAEAWDDFLHRRWRAAARALGATLEQVQQAAAWMRRNLSPYPLAVLDQPGEAPAYLPAPDLIVRRGQSSGQALFWLEVPGEQACPLRLAPDFERCAGAGLPAPERAWLRTHLERAQLVLQGLQQRWRTLRRLGEFLLERQSGFFKRGPQALKPLTRAQAARALGLHESTISRAVQEKTLQMPDGRLVPLSDFFDPSLAVKACLQEILEQEATRQISDRELAARLAQRGHRVARRTVSKYRLQLSAAGSRPARFT